MEMVQVNFRCPEDIRPVLLRIGARLRDDPGFGAVLARWFAGVEAGAALSENPVLSGRLTEIERRLFALERQAPAVPVQAPAPAVVAPVVDDAPAVPAAPEADALAPNSPEFKKARARLNAKAARRGFSFGSDPAGNVTLRRKGSTDAVFAGTMAGAEDFLAEVRPEGSAQ